MPSLEDVLLQNLVGLFPFNGDALDPTATPGASTPTVAAQNIEYVPGWNGEQVAELSETNGAFPSLAFSAAVDFTKQPTGASVSFFVKIDDREIITYYIKDQYGFWLTYASQDLIVSFAGSDGIHTGVKLPAGRWVHVALSVSFDDNSLELWIDGKSEFRFGAGDGGLDPRIFTTATMTAIWKPVQLARYTITQCPLTDQLAEYLASDLFRPEGPTISGVDYVAIDLADGAEAGILLPDSPIYAPGKGFTFSTWVNTESLDIYLGAEDEADRADPTPQPVAYLLEREGVFSLGLLADGRPIATFFGPVDSTGQPTVSLAVIGISSIPIDDWAYVSMVVSPQSCWLYFDGRENGRGDFTGPTCAPASAALTFGRNYPKPLYSAEFYGLPLDPAGVSRKMNQVASAEDEDLLAYYDFSTRPCTATTRSPAPQAQPVLPANVDYAQYTDAAILAWNGYIDCGFPPQTDLSCAITIEAWINPTHTVGTNVIVSRFMAGQGFSLQLDNGVLNCLVADGARSMTVSADFALPVGRWTQVGVIFDPSGGLAVSLFVNGQVVALQGPSRDWAPTASAITPLAVGARFAAGSDPADGGTPFQSATDGFTGYLQRLSIFAGAIDPQDLYFLAPAQPLPGLYDWLFAGLAVTDLVGGQPATPQNGAVIGETSEVISGDQAELLSRRDLKNGRPPRWRGAEPAPLKTPTVPDAHRPALSTPADNLGGRAIVEVGERRYFVAYGSVEGSAAQVVLSSPTSDPSLIWISIALDIVQIVLTLFGASAPDQQKYIKAGEDMWRNPAVRAVVRGLTTFEPAYLPGATFSLFRALYDAGSLRALIGAFDFSFFGVLRLLALFAPWVGLLGIVAQLAVAVADLVKQIEKLRTLIPDPAVGALVNKASTSVTGLPVLTVNGLAATVTVWLEGPTDEPVTVTPRQTLFTCEPPSAVLAGVGQKQTFSVNVAVHPDTAAPTGPNALVFDTPIRAAAAEVSFDVQITRPVAPDEIQLTANAQGDYTGELEIRLSSEVNSDLTLTLTPEDCGSAEMSFDPADPIVFTADGPVDVPNNNPSPTMVTRSVTMKNAAAGQTASVRITGNARKADDPGDQTQRKVRVTCATATEDVRLTMMNADSGNSFFLQSTKTEVATGNTFVGSAMIDGGYAGTYDKFSAMNLLPMNDPLAVMICTHYDADHIGGLLAFFAHRPGQVQHVVFNPAAVVSARPATASRGTIDSILQSAELAAYAAGILVSPHGFGAPPGAPSKQPNISLPTLDILFGGPDGANWDRNQARPGDSEAINRASIISLFKSNVSGMGFKALFTGDGYNTAGKPDVTGWLPAYLPALHFLQVPHHGSKANSDQTLYAKWRAENYLFSANGHSHVHPSSEVIEAIVLGNRAQGRSGYALWFSASSFQRSKPTDDPVLFPVMTQADEYLVYMRKDGALGGTFTFADDAVGPPDMTQWVKMTIPLASTLQPFERVVIYEDQVLVEDIRLGRASGRPVGSVLTTKRLEDGAPAS